MPDAALVEKLANLGGMALCVYILVRVVVQLATNHANDLKESAAREREGRNSLEELHRTTLTALANFAKENISALADVKSAVERRNLEDTWTGRKPVRHPDRET